MIWTPRTTTPNLPSRNIPGPAKRPLVGIDLPNRCLPTPIAQQPTIQATSFLDTFEYKHKRIILELAILLTSEKKFEEFTQALMAFLTNLQMVDSKFVINPLNPDSKGKNISSKGEISSNMTKLGEHIKISGNGNVSTKGRFGIKSKMDANRAKQIRRKNSRTRRRISLCLSCQRLTPRKSLHA